MPRNPDFPPFIDTKKFTQEQRDYFLADIDFGGINHQAFLALIDADEPDDRGTVRVETSADEMDTPSADSITHSLRKLRTNQS